MINIYHIFDSSMEQKVLVASFHNLNHPFNIGETITINSAKFWVITVDHDIKIDVLGIAHDLNVYAGSQFLYEEMHMTDVSIDLMEGE